MVLYQSFPSVRGGKARLKTAFHFSVQKRPVPEFSDTSLVKRPHLDSKAEACQGVRKSSGGSVSVSELGVCHF